jgi:multiple sugar transport system ATP-binding protein
MSVVQLDRVSKVYPNGTHAVSELSLSIEDGEFMVLVGPSGCGKTTALRMVAGLEEITSGTIRIGDRTVNDLAPKDRDIAMVFQNYALYPHMTVGANIGFPLQLHHVPKEEIARRVTEAGKLLGLDQLLDRKPSQLSGGQRQRVAMGRAIVREPSVFLMDEPLSNLDAKLRVQMRAEVARLQRRVGVTTLYVTHDQTEAMTMGDRVAVMRAGLLEQVDTPQALYDDPDSLFVGAFIGSPSMNLYEAGFITSGDGQASIDLGSQNLDLPSAVLTEHPGLGDYKDRRVVVGIRPEDLSEEDGEPASAGDHMKADVLLVEALGSESLVHFDLGVPVFEVEGTRSAVEETGDMAPHLVGVGGTARFGPRTSVEVGSTIWMRVATERLHFFDPTDGRAIRG